MKQGPFPLSGFVVRIFFGTMDPSDSLPAEAQLHIPAYMPSLYGFPCWVGSLQFRTTLSTHAVSSTPGDSSMVLPSSSHLPWPSLMSAKLGFSLFPVSRGFCNDAAEFTLCYGLHFCSPCCLGRYFVLPLSTSHFCEAPGVATRLLGDYRDRSFTG